ncbi:MAG: AzlC family ABC transporter permease [Ruminiclostridium sp.]|nr:AzlC family ABC transporter permease [Ruminiclostridium sp.]
MKIKNSFLRGLKSGIPIGLGYLSVSFSFGIMAVSMGFHWWQAVIISMITVTSAGQLAGIGIMVHPGQYIEMLISQLTVNVRYSFMAISLSQKTDTKFKGVYRWLLGFFITDEIFAVASNEKTVSRSFFTGLSLIPWLGWTVGTLMGALLGNILPDMLMSALCIAIYGMFVAIVAPKTKKSLSLLAVVLTAIAFSFIFYYTPVLKDISSGISISVCAVLAAVIGAIFFPVKEETANG